jgi:hypothetical protein
VSPVRITGLVLVLAALVLAGVGGRAGASTDARGCTSGIITYGGAQARQFCGPAKATVKVGTKTLKFMQGECLKSTDYVSVNIGTVVLGTTSKPKPNYFGMNIGRVAGSTDKPARKDGKYKGGVLALEYAGKGYLTRGDLIVTTLSGGRNKGVFTTKTFDGKPVSGTFTC